MKSRVERTDVSATAASRRRGITAGSSERPRRNPARQLASYAARAPLFVAVCGILLGFASCAELAPLEGAACDEEHACPSGFFCSQNRCERPTLGCKRDEDCLVGVCLEQARICVGCIEDKDCFQGVCLEGFFCGCRNDLQCAVGFCRETSTALSGLRPGSNLAGECYPCFSDNQCESGQCDQTTGDCEKVQPARGEFGRE